MSVTMEIREKANQVCQRYLFDPCDARTRAAILGEIKAMLADIRPALHSYDVIATDVSTTTPQSSIRFAFQETHEDKPYTMTFVIHHIGSDEESNSYNRAMSVVGKL